VSTARSDNPLLREWSGPFGGLPPFDLIRVEHFEPALAAAMRENLEEIDRIVADPAPPTFENTLAAQERAGRAMTRVSVLYNVWGGAMSTPEFQAVERGMAPRLAEFSDRIMQNTGLFKRVEAVYAARAGLTPEQQRLAWLYHTSFVRAGARLGADQKRRVAEIKQPLAARFTRFSQNVLAD
jgi:peptidyl-dipeptidase Dcp